MSTLIGRVGLVPQGVWSAGNYKLLDVVSYQGKSYVCRANTSTTPSEGTNWMVLASDGAASGSVGTNTFTGTGALQNNTTGSSNVANGAYALQNNTTGSSNVANGAYALKSNTTGYDNVANGAYALYSNTTGYDNVANGAYALYSNTTGSYNAANGYQALYSNTTGIYNAANGNQALYSNTTGRFNSANGSHSLYSNTTAYYNTASGFQALFWNTTGYHNTANGYHTLTSNTTGFRNSAHGSEALSYNTTGSKNTAEGYYSLLYNTTGNHNVGVGHAALFSNITGDANTALGTWALFNLAGNTTPAGSFVIGLNYKILVPGTTDFTLVGAYNSSIGTTFTATGVGTGTGTATLNNQNVAEGFQSAYECIVGANNTSIGANSLYSNSKYTLATALVPGGIYTILTVGTTNFTLCGAASSAVGVVFTANATQGLGTGAVAAVASHNTALGYRALYASEIYNNTTGVGANTAVTGSNQVQLGDSATTTYAYGAIQDRSDIRDKADVRDTTLGLEFINSLRPVDFRWDKREDYRTAPPIKPVYPTEPTYPECADSLQEENELDEDYRVRVSAEFKAIIDEIDALYAAQCKEIDEAFDMVHTAWLEGNKLANIEHDGTHKRTRYHHGVIAQELPAEFGGVQNHALKGGDDVMSVGYEEFIAPLIKAVQELSAENKMLKAHLGL